MDWLRELAVSGVEAGILSESFYVRLHGKRTCGSSIVGPVTWWLRYFGYC